MSSATIVSKVSAFFSKSKISSVFSSRSRAPVKTAEEVRARLFTLFSFLTVS